MSDEILSREPWPAQGIEHYDAIEEGSWEYLMHYRLKGFVFETSQKPSPEEILLRWGYHFGH